jgi:hypothetical protein
VSQIVWRAEITASPVGRSRDQRYQVEYLYVASKLGDFYCLASVCLYTQNRDGDVEDWPHKVAG